ncbi:hypothetical protein LTR94_034418, partial [Friedmanniomyces endolithicus]
MASDQRGASPAGWAAAAEAAISDRAAASATNFMTFPLDPSGPVMHPLPDAIGDDRGETADQGGDQHDPEAAAQPVFARQRPGPGRQQRPEPGKPVRRSHPHLGVDLDDAAPDLVQLDRIEQGLEVAVAEAL